MDLILTTSSTDNRGEETVPRRSRVNPFGIRISSSLIIAVKDLTIPLMSEILPTLVGVFLSRKYIFTSRSAPTTVSKTAF